MYGVGTLDLPYNSLLGLFMRPNFHLGGVLSNTASERRINAVPSGIEGGVGQGPGVGRGGPIPDICLFLGAARSYRLTVGRGADGDRVYEREVARPRGGEFKERKEGGDDQGVDERSPRARTPLLLPP